MAFDFSTISDSTLLPFAQTGAVKLEPRYYWENPGEWFEISGVFEDRLSWGDQSYTGIRVFPDGKIQFGNGLGWQNTYIAPLRANLDTHVANPDIENSGVWIETNTERDSVIITWNGVGQYYRDIRQPNTYQVELIDRGNGDAEIIYRFADMRGNPYSSPYYDDPRNFFRVDGEQSRSPLGYLPINFSDFDTTIGNTGVAGVWQFQIEEGVLRQSDLVIAPLNLTGDADDNMLTGWLGSDTLIGLDGNDSLIGEFGNDSLFGDAGDDVIDGGGGNDYITGGDGNDYITGGAGNDLIGAGAGDDTVLGGGGNDTIHGAGGVSDLSGGNGDDLLVGGTLDDILNGDDGNDTLNAGDGNDTLYGGSSNDTLYGGGGDNLVYGNDGNDFIAVGSGNDFINAGSGSDRVLAGAGNDTVYVGGGADTVHGGTGDDLIVNEVDESYSYRGNELNGMEGNDTVTGGIRNDTLTGGEGDDVLRGRAGSDLIGGGDGNDRILGDDGNDTSGFPTYYDYNSRTYRIAANDTLYGGAGDDWIFGAAGDDVLTGDEGNDTLLGGYGDDLLNGGQGDDFLFGAIGEDTLTGGPGADRFFITSYRSDVTVITDYNADEGDGLVLSGGNFDLDRLRLVGSRSYDIYGNPAEYTDLSLVRIGDVGGVAQTLFIFENASQIDRLIFRIPAASEDPNEFQLIDLLLF